MVILVARIPGLLLGVCWVVVTPRFVGLGVREASPFRTQEDAHLGGFVQVVISVERVRCPGSCETKKFHVGDHLRVLR